jgi:hypothetical protein
MGTAYSSAAKRRALAAEVKAGLKAVMSPPKPSFGDHVPVPAGKKVKA